MARRLTKQLGTALELAHLGTTFMTRHEGNAHRPKTLREVKDYIERTKQSLDLATAVIAKLEKQGVTEFKS